MCSHEGRWSAGLCAAAASKSVLSSLISCTCRCERYWTMSISADRASESASTDCECSYHTTTQYAATSAMKFLSAARCSAMDVSASRTQLTAGSRRSTVPGFRRKRQRDRNCHESAAYSFAHGLIANDHLGQEWSIFYGAEFRASLMYAKQRGLGRSQVIPPSSFRALPLG